MARSLVLLNVVALISACAADARGGEPSAGVTFERVLTSSPEHLIDDIAIDSGGRFLASTGWAGEIELWDVRSGRSVAKLGADADADWACVSFSACDGALASCSSDGTVKLWSTETKRLSAVLRHGEAVADVVFSPDGTQVIAAEVGGVVRIWDRNRCSSRSIETSQWPDSISISADGRVLATVDARKSVKLWDWQSGKLKAELEDAKGINTKVHFSKDGRLVFGATSWHEDQRDRIRIWDVGTGRVTVTFESVEASVVPLALSPDAGLIAAGGLEAVHLLDATTGEHVATVPNGNQFVEAVEFFPNGRRIAVGGRDGQIRIWKLPARVAR